MNPLHKFTVSGAGADLDRETHSLYGVILTSGHVDQQNQTIGESELEKAAARFLRNPSFKLNHRGRPLDGIELAESYVAPASFTLPSGARVLKGQWVIKIDISDYGLYEQFSESPPTGFSIGGTGGLRKLASGADEIYDLNVNEISILTDGEKPAQRPSRVLALKSEIDLEDPEVIAKLKEVQAELTALRLSQMEQDVRAQLSALQAAEGPRRARSRDKWEWQERYAEKMNELEFRARARNEDLYDRVRTQPKSPFQSDLGR